MLGRKGKKSKRQQQNKVLCKDKELPGQIQVGKQLWASTSPQQHPVSGGHTESTAHGAEHKWGLIQHLPQAQAFPKAHRERCSQAEFWNNLCSAQALSELSK